MMTTARIMTRDIGIFCYNRQATTFFFLFLFTKTSPGNADLPEVKNLHRKNSNYNLMTGNFNKLNHENRSTYSLVMRRIDFLNTKIF